MTQLTLTTNTLPPRALAAIDARLDRIDASPDLRRRYTSHWREKYARHLANLRFGEPARGSVLRRLNYLRRCRDRNGDEGVSVGIAVIECALEVADER